MSNKSCFVHKFYFGPIVYDICKFVVISSSNSFLTQGFDPASTFYCIIGNNKTTSMRNFIKVVYKLNYLSISTHLVALIKVCDLIITPSVRV